MKKILVLFFVLISFFAKGQYGFNQGGVIIYGGDTTFAITYSSVFGGTINVNGFHNCSVQHVDMFSGSVINFTADGQTFTWGSMQENSHLFFNATINAAVTSTHIGQSVTVLSPTTLLSGGTFLSSEILTPYIVDLSASTNSIGCLYTGTHTSTGNEAITRYLGAVHVDTTSLFIPSFVSIGGIPYVSTSGRINEVTVGTSSQPLLGGTHPAFGTLPVAGGGTNITSYAIGDLLAATGSTTLTKIPDVAKGSVWCSGGVTALGYYAKVRLDSAVAGILPIANGGTGSSSYTPFTTDSIPFYFVNGTQDVANKNTGEMVITTSSGLIQTQSGETDITQSGQGLQIGSNYMFGGDFNGIGNGTFWGLSDGSQTINFTAANNISFNGPVVLPNYTTNGGILTTDGSGNLTQLATDIHAYYTLHADNNFRQVDLQQDVSNTLNVGSITGDATANKILQSTASSAAPVWSSKILTLGTNLIVTGSATTTLTFPTDTSTYTFPASTSTLLAASLGISGGTTIIGSTSTNSGLTLRSTSGVGSSSADIIFQTGNNGATEVGRFLNAGQFGIGVASPTAMLHLKAGTASASTASLKLPGGVVLTAPEIFAMESDSANIYWTPYKSSSPIRYRITGNGLPTIAAGVGAGTSPTISVAGNDGAMTVSITTGTLPTGTNAVVATITFNKAFGSTPRVVFSPANAITALLSGATMVYMDAAASTTTFVITSGTTALTAATTYKWNVLAGQ